MAKFNGFKQAIDLLNHLSPTERNKLMQEMAKQDPKLTDLLDKNLVSIEDLQYASVKMVAELLREINLEDLALSLRICSTTLREHILNCVSSRLKTQIEEVLLGPPKPVSLVEESIERVMLVVKEKIEKGELILDPNGDKYI